METDIVRERLRKVQSLCFTVKSRSSSGWSGCGKGNVEVEEDGDTIVFTEKGIWKNDQGREFRFANVYRWTIDDVRGVIHIEHLRLGGAKAVYLLELACVSEAVWASKCGHRCQRDLYTAGMKIGDEAIRLTWKVKGPSKDEEITCSYV